MIATTPSTRVSRRLLSGRYRASRLFHAAGRNRTQTMKFSLVCTYRAADNLPLQGTKSASVGDVAV